MTVTEQLYDSHRALHDVKPRWRGRSRLLGFAMSLVAGPWLVLVSDGPTARLSMTVLYATGAVLHHRRHLDLRPSVFGYHEVFHVFVCAGATCHFVAIAVFLR